MSEEEILEEVRAILAARGWVDELTHPVVRSRNASSHVARVLRLARALCGQDVLRTAYGDDPGSDRQAVLHSISNRVSLAAYLFDTVATDDATLRAVATEANAVASGDDPHMFARIPGMRRKAVRVLSARFDALRWHAYLEGLGLTAADRQGAIEAAYIVAWPSVRRRWREQAETEWGSAEVSHHLLIERRDGEKRLRRWCMGPAEPWSIALKRAGERYKRALKAHADLAPKTR